MNFIMILLQGIDNGIDNGTFVVPPESVLVWYALVLLLFSDSAGTDTGSKSFDCALGTHTRFFWKLSGFFCKTPDFSANSLEHARKF
jgi:hypothetical protein